MFSCSYDNPCLDFFIVWGKFSGITPQTSRPMKRGKACGIRYKRNTVELDCPNLPCYVSLIHISTSPFHNSPLPHSKEKEDFKSRVTKLNSRQIYSIRSFT